MFFLKGHKKQPKRYGTDMKRIFECTAHAHTHNAIHNSLHSQLVFPLCSVSSVCRFISLNVFIAYS